MGKGSVEMTPEQTDTFNAIWGFIDTMGTIGVFFILIRLLLSGSLLLGREGEMRDKIITTQDIQIAFLRDQLQSAQRLAFGGNTLASRAVDVAETIKGAE